MPRPKPALSKSSQLSRYLNLRTSLIELGLARSEDILGCSLAEIQALEQQLNLALPASYRDYLRIFGQASGLLWQAPVEVTAFAELPLMQRWLRQNLLRNGHLLPSLPFAFSLWNGYRYHFFLADEGPDPQIYEYNENEAPPQLLYHGKHPLRFSRYVCEVHYQQRVKYVQSKIQELGAAECRSMLADKLEQLGLLQPALLDPMPRSNAAGP